jgi:hypothetical protein
MKTGGNCLFLHIGIHFAVRRFRSGMRNFPLSVSIASAFVPQKEKSIGAFRRASILISRKSRLLIIRLAACRSNSPAKNGSALREDGKGFARMKCKDCRQEYLLAFSCKCCCFQLAIFNAFLFSILSSCRC